MKSIIDFLASEIEIQERHLYLVTEQNNALIACNRTLFRRLQEEYEVLTTELEAHAARRVQTMPATAYELETLMAKWSKPAQAQAHPMLTQLREMLATIGSLTAQNSVLIENEQKLIRFQINLIITAITNGVHYIQNGQKEARQTARLVNRVA